jgi:hypothetical protein
MEAGLGESTQVKTTFGARSFADIVTMGLAGTRSLALVPKLSLAAVFGFGGFLFWGERCPIVRSQRSAWCPHRWSSSGCERPDRRRRAPRLQDGRSSDHGDMLRSHPATAQRAGHAPEGTVWPARPSAAFAAGSFGRKPPSVYGQYAALSLPAHS